ncbi:MAG: hypothetical protein WB780_13825 [Candidatus Acidiferrales bacterium]
MKEQAEICQSAFAPEPHFCCDGSQPEKERGPESGPNALAAAELQSLERGIHIGAKGMRHEIVGSQLTSVVENWRGGPERLQFPEVSAAPRRLPVSGRPKPRDGICSLSNRKSGAQSRSLAYLVQSRATQDRDKVRRTAAVELCPAQRNGALFRSVFPYGHHVAAAS